MHGSYGVHGSYGGAGEGSTLPRAWEELSRHGARPLVVRSSSPQEDTRDSSLAGQFDSVLDVRGWAAFRAAVRVVLDSARRTDGGGAPMAVLVQPMLRARVGGVLFGADPVAGRTDRMLVSAVRGGPDTLVSGEQPGTSYWLSRRGRLLRTEPAETAEPTGTRESASAAESIGTRESAATVEPGEATGADPLLTASELRRLARLARRAARVFGGPQDIEFGFGEDGRLWLFQSRPITAMAARPARGARLLGPGPVAETLPGQLEPLEEDLWVAPMARGLAFALDIGGTAPHRQLRTMPVVTTVGGRAAADLRLLGAAPPGHPRLAWLNPAPGARRLGAAWRVGRLTSTLPGLATDLVADVDRRLTETPPPAELPTAELISTLRWTRATLVSLHAQEALAGALLPEPRVTAAGTALARLTETRLRETEPPGGDLPDPGPGPGPGPDTAAAPDPGPGPGPGPDTAAAPAPDPAATPSPSPAPDSDHHAVAAAPVLLALTAPSLWDDLRLPRPEGTPGHDSSASATAAHGRRTATPPRAAAPSHHAPSAPTPVGALPPREALRLRIRWVQELQVRLVREAARRLLVRGVLVEARRAGLLRWKEFVTALEAGALPHDFEERLPGTASAPLPDLFRLTDGGAVVAERTTRRWRSGARRSRAQRSRAQRSRAQQSGDGGQGMPGGRGVSGGRIIGTAWDGEGSVPPEAVLVVRTLDPALAPLLPRLAGLVAQTGSPLSHLAVLAREFGVPAVVGVADAVDRFPPGTRLTVDGTAGDVRIATAHARSGSSP
ncbi:PEP/pyruvate-binding domain-containing protein [Streptomyces adelaidensis]|uniref:PEP/pyruvate-binding domain-containing protein n=1 Tax=Streptomyces adelaidensis TaxID=2796465 RepID=UPI0027DAD9F3|nr:PEP/pyruvate-binding domain-containing protein [Streptomyces adelaidensis]